MGDNAAVSLALTADTQLGIITGLTMASTTKPKAHRDSLVAIVEEDGEDKRVGSAATATATDRTRRKSSSLRISPVLGEAVAQTMTNNAAATTTSAAGATSTSPSQSAMPAVAKKCSVHERRQVIKRLQERNQVLKQELAIEERDAKNLLASDKRMRMEYLQRLVDAYAKKVEIATVAVAKLDDVIAKKERELAAIRLTQASSEPNRTSSSAASAAAASAPISGESENGAALRRRVQTLENRLELTIVKRNEVDSINKHLREQIEKVRKDRVIFDGIYKKLEKELTDFQQRSDISAEELKKATANTNQVNLELQQLQARADTEQTQYEEEFRSLKQQIEREMRETREWMEQNDLEDMGFKNLESGATPMAGTAQSTIREAPLKRIVAKSSWKIGLDKALLSSSEGTVAQYDQAFDGIKQISGIRNISEIAQEIQRKDEENFKRFKHVEELRREHVTLHTQGEQLSAEIDAFKAQNGISTTTTSQKLQARIMEERYQQAKAKNKAYDAEYEDVTTRLTRMKSSIHSIHTMLAHANCARSVDAYSHGTAHLALGSHSAREVMDSNVLEYLQAIETLASSLMKENHEARQASEVESAVGSSTDLTLVVDPVASSPIGHGPATLSADPTHKLQVQVPSIGGLNGALILPPAVPAISTFASSPGRPLSPFSMQQQQTQRKASRQMDLSSHNSLPQMSMPSAPTMPPMESLQQVLPTKNLAMSTPESASTMPPPIGNAPTEYEEEEERAFTYEELREFAANHLVKKPQERAVRRSSQGSTLR